jgi:NAD(P)-dependent dehydrogenase (short-subunit alcohol dehydrogenase family)
MYKMGKVEGKRAMVTGAAMGNGLGAATKLAEEGARVALCDVSEKVFESAKELESRGYTVMPLIMDVRDLPGIGKTVGRILDAWGGMDILVNNAGVCKLVKFLDTSDEDRDWQWDVNVRGIWNCCKAVIPHMVKQRYGKVVNMSSVTGPIVTDIGDSAYGSTKAAIIGLTKSLALELAEYGITVNAICPGYILTPGVRQAARESEPENPQSVVDAIAGRVPMKRLGTIEELGNLAAFLASDESSYITGTHIVIDGGAILPETSGAVHAR